MNNQEKGLEYEIYIRNYIRLNKNNVAYLWNDIPERILIEFGIIDSHNQNRLIRKENKENPLNDTGVDVLEIEEINGIKVCSFVQCKNGYKTGLTVKDLAGIMMWSAIYDKNRSYIYYTEKLSKNITLMPKNDRIQFIKQELIKEKINRSIKIKKIKPFNYQTDAKKKFIEHLKKNNRGILSMPCGTGKSFTSFIISEDFKQIIILSPLKQFAKQNLDKYIEYGYTNNYLLIDSDGERNVSEVTNFIESNESFLLSATFCSVDIINLILKKTKNPLIIIDEFHNISKNNIIDTNDDFYKILNSKHKILFMSATPRIYELEDDDYDDSIFGNIVYNMSFTEAISNKYITDYKIWLPSINETNTQLKEELKIYEIDDTIKAKCIFLMSCLLNNGSKKCIIYCIDTKEIDLMINAINKLNEFYVLNITSSKITSSDSHISRTTILNNFVSNNNIQLLFSVRILDECIDIPSCDSIFITYPTNSKIRTIQRISRCMRIDTKNPFKIGNIYIWCSKYEQILETLSGIKEYDQVFKEKILINQNMFYGKDNTQLTVINKDIELVKNYIIGIKEFKQLTWHEKLNMLEDFIIKNNRLPLKGDDKTLNNWVHSQKSNYKLKKEIMQSDTIQKLWENFMKKNNTLFLNNIEIWLLRLEEVENFILKNNRLPLISDDKILNNWVHVQKKNYKSKNYNIQNDTTKKLWEDFVKKNNTLFLNNDEIWMLHLEEVEKFILDNNKLPPYNEKDKITTKLRIWIIKQEYSYKKKLDIMKNKEIREVWEEFINKNSILFETPKEKWMRKFTELKEFVITNNRFPVDNKNKPEHERKLEGFMSNNKTCSKNNIQIMSDPDIKNIWNIFFEDYQNKFKQDKINIWNDNLIKLDNFIQINKKLPSKNNKDDNEKELSYWFETQKKLLQEIKNDKLINSIMANDKVIMLWNNFIEKHKEYFKSNEEIWFEMFDKVKNYIQENKKYPSSYKINENNDKEFVKIAYWFGNMRSNYRKKNDIMKNEEFRLQFEELLDIGK